MMEHQPNHASLFNKVEESNEEKILCSQESILVMKQKEECSLSEIQEEGEIHVTRPDQPIEAENIQSPPINLIDCKDSYQVFAELTRTQAKDIVVHVRDNQLLIGGTRKEIECKADSITLIKEIQVGPFKRSLDLPEAVDEHVADASYDGSLLQVKLKKRKTKDAAPNSNNCALQ